VPCDSELGSGAVGEFEPTHCTDHAIGLMHWVNALYGAKELAMSIVHCLEGRRSAVSVEAQRDEGICGLDGEKGSSRPWSQLPPQDIRHGTLFGF